MFLFVGLGNPGKEYEKTRHNIGFMVIDEIANSYNFSPFKSKFHGNLSEGNIAGNKVIALKPTTYMNKSGLSVGEAVTFYKIPLDKIIVFQDEIDLNLSKIRVKIGGGAGGHNGIKDIDSRIGKDYKRVRLGVGHPGDRDMVSNYVLSNFAKDEEDATRKIIEAVAAECPYLLKGEDSLFMTRVTG